MISRPVSRRTFLKLVIGAGASGFLAAHVLGRPARAAVAVEPLDQLLEPIRLTSRMPALGGAAIRGSELIGLGVTGTRQAAQTNPVRADDRFHIGSCTKAMTATLLAMVVERGALSWEATIGEVLPDIKPKIRTEYHGVTLRQLLGHQSGLPDDRTPDPDLLPLVRALSGSMPAQRRRLAELVLSRPPAAPPGTTFQYSNYGYTIAGAFAEQATGQSWETLMQERIFRALGMTSAGFGAPGGPGSTDQPWGHAENTLRPVPPGPNADNVPVIGPAGTLHCTLADWGKFAALHGRGARGDAGLLLRPETFQQLHRPSLGSYALGWRVEQRDWADGPALTHTGSNRLWYAVIWLAPRRNMGFLAATNAGGEVAFRACDMAIGAMIRKYLN